MRTVIPINIAALRVSATDATNIVIDFKGRMGAFDQLPYVEDLKRSSTGDALLQPLESENSPLSKLREGIHLHWELPDSFKGGTQQADGRITFPKVPNRWLVTRYLCKYNREKGGWLPPTAHSWVVESDYIAHTPQKDKDDVYRASVPVPLPVNVVPGEQPYRYMGRVVEGAVWPLVDSEDKYLKDFTDAEGNPYYLTAIGFLGPAFSAYYPDCCSVFGFHDRFIDEPEIFKALTNAHPIQFKASYHVVGWIDGEETVLCNGIMQEIVWDMLDHPGASNFLGNPEPKMSSSVWEDHNIRLSLGNTVAEAISALLSPDISPHQQDNVLQNNYEYLLNMLQTGRIEEIDTGSNLLSKLEKGLHADGFASEQSGLEWIIQKKEQSRDDNSGVQAPVKESHLPLPLYHSLQALNQVQNDYDTSRCRIETERKQLFMDWYQYIKIYTEEYKNQYVDIGRLSAFIERSFKAAMNRSKEVGILTYAGSQGDGVINSVRQPKGITSSKAYTVWTKFEQCREEVRAYPEWKLLAIPAGVYRLPTDPVVAIEVDSLRCKMRNGEIEQLFVRTTAEIIDKLVFVCDTFTETVETKDIPPLLIIQQRFSHNPDILKLCDEARLLIPSLASQIAAALKNKGGAGNPAVENEQAFLRNLAILMGGGGSIDAPQFNAGIFNKIREEDYQPVVNPTQQTLEVPQLTITFTNALGNGRLTHPLGWNTQELLADLSKKRHDPFLPVSIIWKAVYQPIKRNQGEQNYGSDNITRYFTFNNEATDYTYDVDKPFTDEFEVKFTGSNILIKNAIQGLTTRIGQYAQTDEGVCSPEIDSKVRAFKERKIISQTLGGFNANALLRNVIPAMPLMDLTQDMDDLTNSIINRGLFEMAQQGDDCYAHHFNTQSPITVGGIAEMGFCPLRSGFLGIESLEIVDVFGQRMQLFTPKLTNDGMLQLLPSTFLSPLSGDRAHLGKAFLPPRLLTPTRLYMKWIDASPQLSTPACGWVLPNHLDHALFFYDHDGIAIGSFGIEHGAFKYRTCAGNKENPTDTLSADIGTLEAPKVNRWLAHFMRYIDTMSKRSVQFLVDLMQVVLNSENFISPEKNLNDSSLAVLTGRPLAIARISLGIETNDATFPLNQSAMNPTDPWVEDVENGCIDYSDRVRQGAAALNLVQLPVRLGDRLDMDDGLVGYLLETNGTDDASNNNPYGTGYFYAPAANNEEGKASGVVYPADTNLLLNLNGQPQILTMLVDPRAGVHALTGLLPVEVLEFPPNHFAEAVEKLEMTFFTHPLLQQNLKFTVLLPEQKGYAWSWVTQHQEEEIPLQPPYSQEDISWGYSPQTLEEGWIKLRVKNEE